MVDKNYVCLSTDVHPEYSSLLISLWSLKNITFDFLIGSYFTISKFILSYYLILSLQQSWIARYYYLYVADKKKSEY